MLTVPTRSCLSLLRKTNFGNSAAAAVPLPVTSVVKENWNLAFIGLFRFLFAGSLGRETPTILRSLRGLLALVFMALLTVSHEPLWQSYAF